MFPTRPCREHPVLLRPDSGPEDPGDCCRETAALSHGGRETGSTRQPEAEDGGITQFGFHPSFGNLVAMVLIHSSRPLGSSVFALVESRGVSLRNAIEEAQSADPVNVTTFCLDLTGLQMSADELTRRSG